MPIFFRSMRAEDLDDVFQIESEVFSDPWPKEVFEAEMDHDAFVLTKDERVVGFLCAWQVLDECTITNVAVSPKEQRQGFGEIIILKLFEVMDKRLIRFYYLEVRASNQAATRLYHKLGFREIGIRKAYYQHPVEDAIVMSLTRPLG
jgi:ribosomal-protein-alanine N-acetyltransferase